MHLSVFLGMLKAAGVPRIAIDPAQGKVRMIRLPDAVRALVAAHKPQLLALAGTAPLEATPDELAALVGAVHSAHRAWTPAPDKRGGYTSAESADWLVANGWRRTRDGWVGPTGTMIAQPLPERVVTFGHDKYLALEGKPAWFVALADGRCAYFADDTQARRWAEEV